MRADKKRERALAKGATLFAEMAKSLGMEVPETIDIKASIPRNSQNLHMEAEATLLSIKKPGDFENRVCSRAACGQYYLTNYRAQAYCSLNCVRIELASIGITFDPAKPLHERWGGEPPLTVPQEALTAMRTILEREVRRSIKQTSAGQEFLPFVQPEPSTNSEDPQPEAQTNHHELLLELGPLPDFSLD